MEELTGCPLGLQSLAPQASRSVGEPRQPPLSPMHTRVLFLTPSLQVDEQGPKVDQAAHSFLLPAPSSPQGPSPQLIKSVLLPWQPPAPWDLSVRNQLAAPIQVLLLCRTPPLQVAEQAPKVVHSPHSATSSLGQGLSAQLSS